MKHTLRQNIAFFDSADAASVSIQATTNGNNVNTGISEKLTLTVQGISTFVAAFVVAFAVQWKLTLITITIVPTIIITIGVCVSILTKYEAQMLTIYNRAGLVAEEAFSSMRTIHAFWLQPMLSRAYDSHLANAKIVGMKFSPIYMILFSTEFFCTYAGYGLAFWQGIHMYSKGEIKNSGDVVTVIFAVIVAATAMTIIAPQIISLTKASGAAEELFRTIDHASEIDALSEEGLKPSECNGDIVVRDLHFSYPTRPNVPVLQGLDLHIPAKKTTALVGASGSGKSTIVGLLERWYAYERGAIRLDGVEIRDLNIGWLRTNCRLVLQEPILFSGTVSENIAFGLMGTSMADLPDGEKQRLIQSACEAAYAHEFVVQFPHGYETRIGERGLMLSGGQKQRLAIARSIIADPRVLLLDEATSALDPKAENIVQEALDNVSAQRTTLVIAHKLSTVRKADSIAVMSQGKIVEQGTHEQLIAANGAYARLVKAQDLGQAATSSEDTVGDDDDKSLVLVRTPTQAKSAFAPQEQDLAKGKSLGYSLARCLWVILPEQKGLWHIYLVVTVAAIFGGTYLSIISLYLTLHHLAFCYRFATSTVSCNLLEKILFRSGVCMAAVAPDWAV